MVKKRKYCLEYIGCFLWALCQFEIGKFEKTSRVSVSGLRNQNGRVSSVLGALVSTADLVPNLTFYLGCTK